MARFRFRCLSRQSRRPLEAGIFIEADSMGQTSLDPSAWLELNTANAAPAHWFATLWHHKVAEGCATGGDFEILVDERTLEVDAEASDFDLEESSHHP